MIFVWERFCFEVFRSKGARNGPKMSFFRYYQKSMHGSFLIFCMKLQHKGMIKNTAVNDGILSACHFVEPLKIVGDVNFKLRCTIGIEIYHSVKISF